MQVVAPVDDFLTATSDTVWDATLQQIAELVQAHRTTLVFAQSRRAAERLARDLNDRIPDGRVAAHHGSLSRRARLEAENRLKAGELRALVATSSLELGIDVGAIDLVVQVQSPRNVAAALQRVGRAGHLLSRTSKGRIVVTKGEELMEAAAVVRSIRERPARPDRDAGGAARRARPADHRGGGRGVAGRRHAARAVPQRGALSRLSTRETFLAGRARGRRAAAARGQGRGARGSCGTG